MVQSAPIGGGAVLRRWSGQTIAGRSGVPSSRAQTTVPRCVVRARPAIRAGATLPCCHSALAGLGQAAPVRLGVLLGPARCGESNGGSNGTCARAEHRAVRDRRRARARSACRRRSRAAGRRSWAAIVDGRRVPRRPVFPVARDLVGPARRVPAELLAARRLEQRQQRLRRRAPRPGRAGCGAAAGRRGAAPAPRASTSAARRANTACRRAAARSSAGRAATQAAPAAPSRPCSRVARAAPAPRPPARGASRRPCFSTSRSTSSAVARCVVSLPPVMPTRPGRVHIAESRPIADGGRCASPGGTTIARSAGEGRERLRGIEPQPRKRQRSASTRYVGLGRRDRRRHVGDRMVDVGRADQHRAFPDMREHRPTVERMQPGERAAQRQRSRARTRGGCRAAAEAPARPGAAPAQTPAACTVTVALTSRTYAVEPVFEARAGDAAVALDQGRRDVVEGVRTVVDRVEDQAQDQAGVVDDAVAKGDRGAQCGPSPARSLRAARARSGFGGVDAPRGAPAGHPVGDPERGAERERPRPAACVDRHQERLRLDQPGPLDAAAARARAPTRASAATGPTSGSACRRGSASTTTTRCRWRNRRGRRAAPSGRAGSRRAGRRRR